MSPVERERTAWTAGIGFLLALYPSRFRRLFADDLLASFALEWARRRRDTGRSAAWRFGARTLLATFGGLGAEWTADRRWRRRASGGGVMMSEGWMQDLRLAVRRLLRAPSFTAVVVATLALGIGLNTAVFGVIRGALLRPLPYADSERLVYLTGGGASSLPNLLDLQARLESLDPVAGMFVPQDAALVGAGDPLRVSVSFVTDGFFPMLELRPLHGRWLLPEDDGTRRLVLGHPLWQARFGADPAVVGKTITLDEDPWEVVGVAPPSIGVPFAADAWAALPWGPSAGPRASRSWRSVEVYGRLAHGWSLEDARAELATEWQSLQNEYAEANGRWRAEMVGLRSHVTRDEEGPLRILFLATGLLLLIASVNVANVFVARLEGRRHEFAVRSSIGASRWRLLRQSWIEATVVCVAGGMLGTLLAAASVDLAMARYGRTLTRFDEVGLDGVVLLFTLATAVVAALVVGAVAMIAQGRHEPAAALRRASGSIAGRRGRLRRSLVVGEVAMALVIAVGLGLLVRSFRQLQGQDLGIRTEGVVTAALGELPRSRYPSGEADARWLFTESLIERVTARPDVRSAAVTSRPPLSGCCTNWAWHAVESPEVEERFVEVRWVSDRYFATVGTAFLTGRTFEAEGPEEPPVAIIDQELATRLFGGEDPVGRVVSDGQREARVIGVVARVREYSPERPAPPMIYMSARQVSMSQPALVIRSDAPLEELVPGIRSIVRELDPLLPMDGVRVLDTVVHDLTADRRATTFLMGLLGGLALLLGGIGVYGVSTQAVQERVREIGVRLALGASRQQVRQSVLSDALRLVVPGITLGVVGAVLARPLLRSLLYEISALDPWAYGTAVVVFVAAGVVAAAPSARRASRVDVMEMLRDS